MTKTWVFSEVEEAITSWWKNRNAQLWQQTPVDNWPSPCHITQTAQLFWPAVSPGAAIAWQFVTLDSCPLSASSAFARHNWTCTKTPRCPPTRYGFMQNKLHQSNWDIYINTYIYLSPQRLVILVTFNPEVFLSRCWSNQRSAHIPPSVQTLVSKREERTSFPICCRCWKGFIITKDLIYVP